MLLRLVDSPAFSKEALSQNGTDVEQVLASVRGDPAPELAPMLAMLEALYDQTKERIAALNAHEEESKSFFAEKVAEHKARVEEIEAKFANGTISEEFKANATKNEARVFNYWKGVRDRQSHQYHNALRVQHGTMQRVKKMIDMYKEVIAGKADAETMKEELKRLSPPTVVLLQDDRRSLRQFCEDSLRQLRSLRAGTAAAGERLSRT